MLASCGPSVPDAPQRRSLLADEPAAIFTPAVLADGATAASALGRPWKVTVERDTRSALLVPPGTTVEREVEDPPAKATLRLAYGYTGPPPAAARFAVSLEDAGEVVELFSEELSPEGWSERARWREIELELPATEPGATLRFSTSSEAEWGLDDGLPCFAHPEVVTAGTTERPNIVVLSLDTLRADHLSLYGYEHETSPNIDRRARANGITFRNVVASAPWTLPSHVSMLTGQDAIRHGVNSPTSPTPAEVTTLAERLSAVGYDTIAFAAGGYLAPGFGLTQGFRRYLDRPYEEDASTSELDTGLDAFDAWVDAGPSEPFFALFHTYEIHSPYWVREPYYQRFAPTGFPRPPMNQVTIYAGEEGDGAAEGRNHLVVPMPAGERLPLDREGVWRMVRALYDSGIAYTDERLERLWSGLERNGLERDTIVVLTSDHGESMGERGAAGHTHLYDNVLLVPLVVWLPGHDEPLTVDRQVRSVDLVPTLLELAGAEPVAGLDGRSLVELWSDGASRADRRPAWSYARLQGTSVRLENRTKYVRRPRLASDMPDGEELFDLERDPAELANRAASSELDPFRARLEERLRDDLRGLHLHWRNERDAPWTVVASSPLNQRAGVKQIACGHLDWLGDGRVELEIPPGDGCTLVLEHLAGSELSLEPTSGDAGQAVATGAIDDGVALEWPGVTARLSWVGGAAGAVTDSPRIDPQLEEQLRALGYVQ